LKLSGLNRGLEADAAGGDGALLRDTAGANLEAAGGDGGLHCIPTGVHLGGAAVECGSREAVSHKSKKNGGGELHGD